MNEDGPRLVSLDVLRGAAVMGILLMNITAFALPEAAYLNPAASGGTAPADIAVWTAGFVLVDGKMRALFSLLFGAGMLLVIERAEAAGRSGAAVHMRRMGALLGFGLAHAYLIWAGDILVLYAFTGMLAFPFARRGTRTLVALAVLLFAAQLAILAVLLGDVAALRDAAAAPGAATATRQAWRAIADQVGIPTRAAIEDNLSLYRGGYAAILHARLTTGAATPFLQFVDVGAETLGLMLLGMAGLRSGFLAGRWRGRNYVGVALACYAIAVPPLLWIAAGTIRSNFGELRVLNADLLYGAPFRPVLMLGHAASLLAWASAPGWVRDRIAAAGRAAFSNYLATSLAMTTLFYGYGGGLYGSLDRAELYLIVPLAWAAMLWWSKPWLDRFAYGPFEWAWRSLARGSIQPLRRKKDIATKSH